MIISQLSHYYYGFINYSLMNKEIKRKVLYIICIADRVRNYTEYYLLNIKYINYSIR